MYRIQEDANNFAIWAAQDLTARLKKEEAMKREERRRVQERFDKKDVERVIKEIEDEIKSGKRKAKDGYGCIEFIREHTGGDY